MQDCKEMMIFSAVGTTTAVHSFVVVSLCAADGTGGAAGATARTANRSSIF